MYMPIPILSKELIDQAARELGVSKDDQTVFDHLSDSYHRNPTVQKQKIDFVVQEQRSRRDQERSDAEEFAKAAALQEKEEREMREFAAAEREEEERFLADCQGRYDQI